MFLHQYLAVSLIGYENGYCTLGLEYQNIYDGVLSPQ